jgi:MFS family permease
MRKVLNQYRGLPRPIYWIFIARLVNTMGAFVYPFLTIYLTETLGYSTARAGLYVTYSVVAYVPGALIGGKLADQWGRKRVLLFFQVLAAFCYLAVAVLPVPQWIPWYLIAAAFFNSVAQPAHGAITADLTTPKNRQQAFSFLYLGTNIGFAVGPLIAGFLFNNYLMWIFIGDAITTLTALAFIAWKVPETKPEESDQAVGEERKMEQREQGSLLRVLLKRPLLIVFSLFLTIMSFVVVQMTFTVPLQVNDWFGPDRGKAYYGMLMSVNGLAVIGLTPFLIHWTRKNSAVFNVGLSNFLYLIAVVMLGVKASMAWYFAMMIFWTAGEVLQVTNYSVYLADHTPENFRGRFNSVINIIQGTGYAVGPMMMGRYLKTHTTWEVWPIMQVLALVATVSIMGLFVWEKRSKSSLPPNEKAQINQGEKRA